ncbi:MAG TPA: CBS domain-containing protein [Candidatus Binatia bacterium]
MDQKKVQDWMHRGVITCTVETPVADVAATLDAHDISALVVIDGNGDALGVISRTDLVNARFIAPYMKHWRGLSAQHLMTKPVISVSPDTTIDDAAQLLFEKHIHRLVVVEKTGHHMRPVGILSVTDLARHVEDKPMGG